MPDIDRLIEAWEIFRVSNPYEICDGKEFRAIKEPEYCMGQMIKDTIAILKEQEAVVPINSYGTFRCGNCRKIVGYNDGHLRGYQNNFCSRCGKEVKWD